MKKFLFIVLVLLAVLAGIVAASWYFAPQIAFRLIGAALGGSMEVKRSHVAYSKGGLILTLGGVKTTGTVEGSIEHCTIEFLLTKGVYIKQLVVSDFDLSVRGNQKKLTFYPIPVERAEIRKGLLDYRGRKYDIREITVSNFNTGKTLEFSIDAGVKGMGNIKTHGSGIFGGEKRSDIKGQYSLSQVDMAKVLKHYEGLADSRGTFSYRAGTLTVDGAAHSPYFSIWETFFKKRLGQTDSSCNIHLARTGEITDVTLTNLHFGDSPISLAFRSRQRELLYLRLTTGFLPIPELLAYIDLAQLSEKDWDPLSYVSAGEARISQLVFEKRKRLTAEIDLRHTTAGDGKIAFTDVEGSLQVNGKAVVLSRFSGFYGRSRLHDISGLIPLDLSRDVDVRGRYSADLRDIEGFYKPAGVEAPAGQAEGEFELKGRKGEGFQVAGRGALQNGRLVIRRVPLGVDGEYRFTGDSLEFTRLHLNGSGTDLEVAGEAKRNFARITGRGVINARHLVLASVVPSGYRLDGSVGIDGRISTGEGDISAKGRLALTDLSFEIPNLMRKPAGVRSEATLSFDTEEGGKKLRVDNLTLALGALKAEYSGRVNRGGVIDGHIVLDAPEIQRASGLFFFDTFGARGDLKADIRFTDLRFPVVQLPALEGNLTFRNGGIRLPFLVEPVKAVNIDCGFFGDRFAVDIAGLQVGSSTMEKARLTVNGLERPNFNLLTEMAHFDSNDFRSGMTKPFRLPVIGDSSLMARTSGVFLLTAKTVRLKEVTGENAVLSGQLDRRSIWLKEGLMKTGIGSVSLKGSALLTGVPEVQLTGELQDVDAAGVLTLAGSRTDIIEGKGTVRADLRFIGRSKEEILRSATGRVAVSSRDGVIKRWNLISKLLALTNVYDLFLGRVDLTQRGLSYSRLSATLEGRDGVFHTSDFLIDSPSMVITGRGAVDAAQNTMDGRMLVSPLVMLDRIIGYIPLLRNIFKEKRTGFLFFIYDVKGPTNNPDIRSSYVMSMGKRLFNIFRNTMRLPKDVLDLLPKEEREERPQR